MKIGFAFQCDEIFLLKLCVVHLIIIDIKFQRIKIEMALKLLVPLAQKARDGTNLPMEL